MSKIVNLFREIKNRVLWEKNNLKKHWLGLSVLVCLISVSSTIIFYEAKPYYQTIKNYYIQQKEGYEYATQYLNKSAVGGRVSAQSQETEVAQEIVEEKVEAPISSPVSLQTIAERIYTLESSQGQNDEKCHRVGGHNGYGYSQWVGKNFCLDSDDEVRELVIKWFEKKLKTMSLEEALKLYSGNSQGYVEKFNSLK